MNPHHLPLNTGILIISCKPPCFSFMSHKSPYIVHNWMLQGFFFGCCYNLNKERKEGKKIKGLNLCSKLSLHLLLLDEISSQLLKLVLVHASMPLSTRRRSGPRRWPRPRGESIPPSYGRRLRHGKRAPPLGPTCTAQTNVSNGYS